MSNIENPFVVGDTVFHQFYGEGVIVEVKQSVNVGVQYKSFEYVSPSQMHYDPYQSLSFEPWPVPVHVRPFVPTLKKGDVIMINYCNGRGKTATVIREAKRDVIVKTTNGEITSVSKNSGVDFYKLIKLTTG